MKGNCDKVRLEFESYINSLPEGDVKYLENKTFHELLEDYHYEIRQEYAYDFSGFLNDFFVNPPNIMESTYYENPWTKEVTKCFQDYLRRCELGYHLGEIISCDKGIQKCRIDLENIENNYWNNHKKTISDVETYNRVKSMREKDLESLQWFYNLSFDFLKERYSVDVIDDAINNVDSESKFEDNRLIESIMNGRSTKKFNCKNPLLKEIYERKAGIAIRAGNHIGKSFYMSTISVWALICHKDMVNLNIVNSENRFDKVKGELEKVGNKYFDHKVCAENGLHTNIFRYLFTGIKDEIYKFDTRSNDKKLSAQKFKNTWCWQVRTAKNDLDTKGMRPNKMITMYDEASEIPASTIEGTYTNLQSEINKISFVIMAGNAVIMPDKALNAFVKMTLNPEIYKRHFDVFNISNDEMVRCGVKSNKNIQIILDTCGVESDEFKQRVLGEYINNNCLIKKDELLKIFDVNYVDLCTADNLVSGSENAWGYVRELISRSHMLSKKICDVYVGVDLADEGKDCLGITCRTDAFLIFCVAVRRRNEFEYILRKLWSLRDNDSHMKFIIDRNGVALAENVFRGIFSDYVKRDRSLPIELHGFWGHGYEKDNITDEEYRDCANNVTIFAKYRAIPWLRIKALDGFKLANNPVLINEIAGVSLKNEETKMGKCSLDKPKFKKSFNKSPDAFDSFIHSFYLSPSHSFKRYGSNYIPSREYINVRVNKVKYRY